MQLLPINYLVWQDGQKNLEYQGLQFNNDDNVQSKIFCLTKSNYFPKTCKIIWQLL